MNGDSIRKNDEEIEHLRKKVNEAKENKRKRLKNSYLKLKENKFVKIISGEYLLGKFTLMINILAFLVSWYFNKCIVTAFISFLFGAIYLIYCLLMGDFGNGVLLEIFKYYF